MIEEKGAATHEGIVDPAVFTRTQELLSLRSYQPREGAGHLLTGLAFCADCGAPMTYVREGPRSYMVCQGYRRGGRLGLCTAHSMREDRVLETVRRQLRELAGGLDTEALREAVLRDEGAAPSQRQLDAALRKLEANKKVAQSLYRDRAMSMLTEGEFEELFCAARQERARLEESVRELTSLCRQEERQEELRRQMSAILRFDTLNRGALAALVEKILIYGDKRMEILFKFRAPDGIAE